MILNTSIKHITGSISPWRYYVTLTFSQSCSSSRKYLAHRISPSFIRLYRRILAANSDGSLFLPRYTRPEIIFTQLAWFQVRIFDSSWLESRPSLACEVNLRVYTHTYLKKERKIPRQRDFSHAHTYVHIDSHALVYTYTCSLSLSISFSLSLSLFLSMWKMTKAYITRGSKYIIHSHISFCPAATLPRPCRLFSALLVPSLAHQPFPLSLARTLPRNTIQSSFSRPSSPPPLLPARPKRDDSS